MSLTSLSSSQRTTLDLFSYLILGLGRHRVLAWGGSDGGILADICAVRGASVTAVDSDGERVMALREMSRERIERLLEGEGILGEFFGANDESVPRKAGGRRPVFNQAELSQFGEKFSPADFDVILAPITFAGERDLLATLHAAHRLLHTDGVLAISLPHACFCVDSDDYFTIAEDDASAKQNPLNAIVSMTPDGIPGILGGPIYYRSITQLCDAADETGFILRRIAEHPGAPPTPSEASELEDKSIQQLPPFILLEFGKDKWAP